MLNAQGMAAISAAVWPDGPQRWSAEAIATLLNSGSAFAVCRRDGFALARVAGPEAELLTIDVRPEARGRGMGAGILAEVVHTAQARGATELYLEVETDNASALSLYHKAGFVAVGTRRDYYRKPDGRRADAYTLARYFGTEASNRATGSRPIRA